MQRRRGYHHGDLAQAILDEARRKVEADGLSGFSLASIARSLDVSTAAPYHHFPNNAAVLQRLAEETYGEWVELLWRPLRPLVAAAETPSAAAVIDVHVAVCEAFVDYSVAHSTLVEMSLTDYRPPMDSSVVTSAREWQATSSRLLVDAGVIAPASALVVRGALYCVMRGATAVTLESPRLLPDVAAAGSLIGQLVRAIFAAYAPGTGGPDGAVDQQS